MQFADYTPKSIVVIGDTKPWATNLKQIGGKYVRNLTARGNCSGWIFPKTKERIVREFLASVSEGSVQPLGPQYNQNLCRDKSSTTSFLGSDNIYYQIINVTVPLPIIGQKITLHVLDTDNDYDYEIVEIKNDKAPYESAVIESLSTTESNKIRTSLHVVNGQWKAIDLNSDHIVIFHACQSSPYTK